MQLSVDIYGGLVPRTMHGYQNLQMLKSFT
jgi:hypothetical protein